MKKILCALIMCLVSCGSNDPTIIYKDKPILVNNIRQAVLGDDYNCGAYGYACVGGRTCDDNVCTPAWIQISSDNAPESRGMASAGSIDGKYIVFGGCPSNAGSSTPSATAASYDPSNDTWTSFPALQTSRGQLASVTTPDGIFAFGGLNPCYNGTAVGPEAEAIYSSNDTWTNITSNSPHAYDMQGVYTNNSLVIFGGGDNEASARAGAYLLTLGNEWEDISCTLSGCERSGPFSMFLDGPFVRVWGGSFGTAPDGLLFDIESKTWSTWTVPDGTPDFSTVAVYGAYGPPPRFADDGRRLFYLNAAGNDILIYDRTTLTWSEDTSTPPSGFCHEAATAWTGSELVAWSGLCDSTMSDIGATYQPPAPTE